jgi:diacylglycerol kinase (ATP)
MPPFDRVVVIFNPNSTGDAPDQAQRLHDDLAARLPSLAVELQPTQHAGHARDLAREAATDGRPLIVSVSGDGGYNEVVNGVMHAGNDSATCAVLAAGNANDHRRTTRERPLVDAIVAGDLTRLDLLRLTVQGPNRLTRYATRYAHSYIGLGLTPIVAVDLEKGGKGSLREILTVVRAFARFRPFEIEREGGSRLRFDSIVFANISEMAKVATLSESGEPDDGRFEVITLEHTAKWRVLATALRASTRGLGPQPSVRAYAFTPTKPMPVQVDGEVMDLEAAVPVRVDIRVKALQTIL